MRRVTWLNFVVLKIRDLQFYCLFLLRKTIKKIWNKTTNKNTNKTVNIKKTWSNKPNSMFPFAATVVGLNTDWLLFSFVGLEERSRTK